MFEDEEGGKGRKKRIQEEDGCVLAMCSSGWARSEANA